MLRFIRYMYGHLIGSAFLFAVGVGFLYMANLINASGADGRAVVASAGFGLCLCGLSSAILYFECAFYAEWG